MLPLPEIIVHKRFVCLYDKTAIYHDEEGRTLDHVCLCASDDKVWLKSYIEKYENWWFRRGFIWEGVMDGEPQWTLSRKLLTATGCESNELELISYIAKKEVTDHSMKDVEEMKQKAWAFLASRHKVITTLYEEQGDILTIRLELFHPNYN